MEPTTSFIPKKTLDPHASHKTQSAFGVFTFLSTLLFLGAIGASVGVYLYQKTLTSQITTEKETLKKREARFDRVEIENLSRLDKKLNLATTFLNNHVHMSHVFNLLEQITIVSVRYSKFSYELTDDKKVRLLLGGQAKDYASIALQSDYFGQSTFVAFYEFSNLTLDQAGNVVFDLVITVDHALLRYGALDQATSEEMTPFEGVPEEVPQN